MKINKVGPAIVVLQNGNILVSGKDSYDSTSLNRNCEILDITTNAWRNTTPMNMQKDGHNMVLLNNGEVLAFGGVFGRSCEIFNPTKEEWRITDSIPTDRNYGGETFTKLNDGRIMVIGGSHWDFDCDLYVTYTNCDIFDPNLEKWTVGAPLYTARKTHTATLLTDGRILVSGGCNRESTILKSCEIYSPDTNSWIETDSLQLCK